MRRIYCLVPLLLAARSVSATAPAPGTSSRSVETILFFRHGERPSAGLGQLSCQGLHRALDLPSSAIFHARPDYLFAADPSDRKRDGGASFDYIRPLATIEPLAVVYGLPVNTDFNAEQLRHEDKTSQIIVPKEDPPLIKELLSAKYEGALIYTCWQHTQIADMVNYLLSKAGTPAARPIRWDDQDYDGVLRVTLLRKADGSLDSVTVQKQSEGVSPASDCRF